VVAAGGAAAEECVVRDGQLVAERVRRRVHAEVELLAQVPARPHLRPHVPHAHVVQRDQNRRPPSRVHLRGHGTRSSKPARPSHSHSMPENVCNKRDIDLTCTVQRETASTRL
jgi:hypothetical protein